MRLQYAPEDEAFRAELIAWLAENQPSDEQFNEPKQSSAHMVEWAREWQRVNGMRDPEEFRGSVPSTRCSPTSPSRARPACCSGRAQ